MKKRAPLFEATWRACSDMFDTHEQAPEVGAYKGIPYGFLVFRIRGGDAGGGVLRVSPRASPKRVFISAVSIQMG